MSDDKVQGCVAPAEGPLNLEVKTENAPTAAATGGKKMQVMVGKEAPDFGATAFFKGGFTNIKLSDYRGKWVMLCFYPGDFTFV